MSGRSHNTVLQKWEILLMSARSQEVELAGIISMREALETAYSRAKATQSMRETLLASSRDATRRLNEVLAAGKEAEAGLRRMVESRHRIG
jgi:flagellar hook-basal body complex protein FliE